MNLPHPRGLYAISRETAETDALLDWANEVIDGGAIWLQYRDKSTDTSRRMEQAGALARLCRGRSVRLFINDDADLALVSDADGVHLGAGDGALADARQRLGPNRLIGVSCYDDIDRAQALVNAGADYLAFGAFHPSRNKPAARRATPNLLTRAREWNRPLVAIGGITPDNGGALIQAGADLLAVIGGLNDPSQSPETSARAYAALFSSPPPR